MKKSQCREILGLANCSSNQYRTCLFMSLFCPFSVLLYFLPGSVLAATLLHTVRKVQQRRLPSLEFGFGVEYLPRSLSWTSVEVRNVNCNIGEMQTVLDCSSILIIITSGLGSLHLSNKNKDLVASISFSFWEYRTAKHSSGSDQPNCQTSQALLCICN